MVSVYEKDGCCHCCWLFGWHSHAQTNVAINGQLDIGVLKETGSDTRMMRNHDNLLRFKGTEELGNGTQAVFTLESRWDSSDGARCSGNNATDRLHGTPGVDWQGAANVGVQNREWGRVLLGRVSNVSGENYSKVDPFLFDGIALSVGNMTLLSSSQTPNSLRYDSPSWHGLRFNGSYSVGKESHKRKICFSAGKFFYHRYHICRIHSCYLLPPSKIFCWKISCVPAAMSFSSLLI